MQLLYVIHRIYAISVKLSPAKQSSGIQCLEADSFKLFCFQTITGTNITTCALYVGVPVALCPAQLQVY